jgi:hypothetical protein
MSPREYGTKRNPSYGEEEEKEKTRTKRDEH